MDLQHASKHDSQGQQIFTQGLMPLLDRTSPVNSVIVHREMEEPGSVDKELNTCSDGPIYRFRINPEAEDRAVSCRPFGLGSWGGARASAPRCHTIHPDHLPFHHERESPAGYEGMVPVELEDGHLLPGIPLRQGKGPGFQPRR